MESEQLDKLKEGKTDEQQKVLDYFLSEGGCFSSVMEDNEYDALVKKKIDALNHREKALSKIGIDEDELTEISPVFFEGYVFKNAWVKQQAKGAWVSSAYNVAWLFFSDTQVYIYRHTINLDENKKSESTDEFFYQDVTSISTTSEGDSPKINGEKEIFVDTHKFRMIVPGDSLEVTMLYSNDDIIQGMKQKLREKKNA